MNPFNFEENKALRMNYTKDMCPKTMDILSRNVFIHTNIHWTPEDLQQKADQIIAAAKELG